MAAVTPNANNHAGLGEHDSRFVEIANLPWEQGRLPGIESKTLLVDKERGLVTSLIRMAPGARLPDHEHVLVEQSYVLEGHLVDDDGEVTAGNFVWRPAGSRHSAHSPNGALILAIFQAPNKFFEGDKVIDYGGNDWEASWGHTLAA